MGVPPNHPNFTGIFPFKPTILGFSYDPMVWGTPFKRLKGTNFPIYGNPETPILVFSEGIPP